MLGYFLESGILGRNTDPIDFLVCRDFSDKVIQPSHFTDKKAEGLSDLLQALPLQMFGKWLIFYVDFEKDSIICTIFHNNQLSFY